MEEYSDNKGYVDVFIDHGLCNLVPGVLCHCDTLSQCFIRRMLIYVGIYITLSSILYSLSHTAAFPPSKIPMTKAD